MMNNLRYIHIVVSRDAVWILSWCLHAGAFSDFGTTAVGKSGKKHQMDRY